MSIERHLLIERSHYNINSKISLQRKAYDEKACRYQLHFVRVLPARKLSTRCKLDKYNAYFQGEFTAGPPPLRSSVLVGEDGSASYSSFLYVCFLLVGTYCNWGLKVYNKQCQPLRHNDRLVWNPENYTLALSSTIGFSTAPFQNCSEK